MEQFDVAIVGGGPAGSRCAWRLGTAGARVALIDGSHPREKPCGGGITGRALDIIRTCVDPRSFDAVRVDAATFQHGCQQARMPVDDAGQTPSLVVASRTDLDAALLAGARAAGATVITERVTTAQREERVWTIATRDRTVRSRWLIGADGPNSLIRRRVSAPFDRADLSIAVGFFVRGASSTEIAIAFEDRPAGYLWSFPRPDHLAVGICAQADESSPAVLAPLAADWIARNVPGVHEVERYGWAIPSLREPALERERPAGPGWMLIGDAAGLVDPITREGIFFALESADAAAAALLRAGDSPHAYVDCLRDSIYAELIRAARLKAMFFRPAFTRLLIRALQESAPIRAIMLDLISGRQPYKGLRRRLLATCEFGLMTALMKS